MKTSLLKRAITLSIMVVCICLLPTQAQAASENDLTFMLNGDQESYSVVGCNNSASGDLVIPATYNNKPVTRIDDMAIYECRNLTSITIPSSITSIGRNAFEHSTGSINITDLAAWCKIEHSESGMYKQLYLNGKPITELIIPDGITHIGSYTFRGFMDITSVTIPDSVVTIGDHAFAQCVDMISVTIPSSVTSIGAGAFNDCVSLKSLTIPNSVTSIGNYAFSSCKALISITIPKGVATIGNSTFDGCTSLKNITLPDSITYIGDRAFAECTDLTEIIIPDHVTSIGSYAFENCGISYVMLPKSLHSVGLDAFYDTALTEVYYKGSQADWEKISISEPNGKQFRSVIIYDYTGTQIPCIHTWDSGTITKEATCQGQGASTFTCTVCKTTKTERINPTAHAWDNGTVTKEATCLEEGITTFTCTVCKTTKPEPIQLAAHAWDNGTVTKEATCQEKGVSIFICTLCNAAKTESIPNLTTHTWDDGKCSTCGMIDPNVVKPSNPTDEAIDSTKETTLSDAITAPSQESSKDSVPTVAPTGPIDETDTDSTFILFLGIVLGCIGTAIVTVIILKKKR